MTYNKCRKNCILIFYFTTYCYIIPRDVDHMINNVKGELLVMNSLGIKTNYATHSRKYGIECIVFYDDNVLSEQENIHPSLVGMAVDYLSRYMLERNAKKAFHISLLGASIIDDIRYAIYLTSQIQGLDKQSIICACKLCGYDVLYKRK